MTFATMMQWAATTAHRDEPLGVRRSRNVVTGLAVAFGAAVLSTAGFLLPGWDIEHVPALVIIAAVVFASAVATVALARWLPVLVTHLTAVAILAVLPAVEVLIGDVAAVAGVSMIYVLAAAIVATYYPPLAMTAFLAAMLVGQTVVVLWPGGAEVVPQLVTSASIAIAVAVLVSLLVRHLREQMVTDPLTGLINRRGLQPLFTTALSVAARDRHPFCVVILDLDQFKQLNDTRGHAVGDRVLSEAAAGWQRALRPGDTLARIGGDEFVVLLPACDADQAHTVMDRLLRQTPPDVTCSAGATMFTPADTMDSLLARADEALYRAKANPESAAVMDGEQ